MRCDFFSLTDTGRVRTNNEDTVVVAPELGLAVLADGMGGYNAGEVASQLATEAAFGHLRHALATPTRGARDVRQALFEAVLLANRSVMDAAASCPEWRGMATTLLVVAFGAHQLTVAHVGDSRLYRLRQGQLAPLTRDHSLLQEQIDAGLVPPELARAAQYKNLVTRAVGVSADVLPDVSEHTLEPGDTYLLCSDGLNDMLTDGQMAQLLKRETPLAQAGQALLHEANAAGGRDNISLVLVQCVPEPAPTGLLARLTTP